MAAGKGFIVGYSQGGKCFIKMKMKPVDAAIQVAAENQRHNWSGEDPVVKEHRHIVRQNKTPRNCVQTILANVAPSHGHNLQSSMAYKLSTILTTPTSTHSSQCSVIASTKMGDFSGLLETTNRTY